MDRDQAQPEVCSILCREIHVQQKGESIVSDEKKTMPVPVAFIACHQMNDGRMQFTMQGELKDLTFMYYSIGLHINKIIAEQTEKFKDEHKALPQ